jgi:hypothetical protein
LAYEHVSELLVERGVAIDPTCIWRWVAREDCIAQATFIAELFGLAT